MRGTGARALAQLGGGGGGGGGAAFAFPPWDWAAGSEGFGVGAADFAAVDLSTLEDPPGIACAAIDTQLDGKVLRVRPSTGAVDSTLAGGAVFTVEDEEDGVWAARLVVQHKSAAAADASPTGASMALQVGLALFVGADLAGGYTAGVCYQGSGNLSAMAAQASSAATRAGVRTAFGTGGSGSVMPAGTMDVLLRRTGAQVDIYMGGDGRFHRIGTRAVGVGGDGPGVVGVVASTTAGVLDVMVVRARKLAALPAGVPA